MVTAYFSPFISFAKEHVRSGDVDPTYPLLKAVYKRKGYSDEEALWHTLVYLAFYDLGSADEYIRDCPVGHPLLETTRFKKAIERRSFRANDNGRAFLRAAESTLGQWFWIANNTDKPETGWRAVRQAVEQLPFCGTWSSYKFADLLANVHGFRITAPDIGVGGGSETAGPVPGLSLISGRDPRTCASDVALQLDFYRRSQELGVGFKGVEQFETSLCDFNSFVKGRYYVGHDIDSQMTSLSGLSATYWEARRECFPPEYLGELGGWFGVRKDRMRRK